MGLGDFPNGESLGIPDDVAQQATQWKPRRSIFDALMQSGGQSQGGQPDPGTPPAQPRLVDRINDDPAQPLHSGMETPDMPSSGMNDTPYGPQPTHMTGLEDEYQRLGTTAPQPQQSLKHKILSGLLTMATPVAIRQKEAQQQQQQNFDTSQNNAQRGRLLTEMEAERRLQEQSDMAQPEHMDTDQGPIQFNRQSKQWEPIQIGGQRVGPKAQPKPDNPEQQFFDSPEEANKPLSQRIKDYAGLTQKPDKPEKPDNPEQQFMDSPEEQGKSLTQKLKDYKSATETPQREPQQLAVQPDGTVVDMRPGMKMQPGTQTFAGQVHTQQGEQGAAAAQQYAKDYINSGGFTGPGDEALMEKFFELAKPSSGFRMTQNQMDMLRNAQSWKNSVVARYRHATTGVWFSNEQRQQIADTMGQLAASRATAQGGGQQPAQGASGSSGAKPSAKLKDRVSGQVLVEGKDF